MMAGRGFIYCASNGKTVAHLRDVGPFSEVSFARCSHHDGWGNPQTSIIPEHTLSSVLFRERERPMADKRVRGTDAMDYDSLYCSI
jgi:hypothetical protein